MGFRVPVSYPIQLSDVKAYDRFALDQPNDLDAAITKAQGATGSIPYRTHWDSRYANVTRTFIDSLADFTGYGSGGLSSLGVVYGSHWTVHTFDSWMNPNYPGSLVRVIDVVADPDNILISMSYDTTTKGSVTVTVNVTTNNSGVARGLTLRMRITLSGATEWQSYDYFVNQPSL